MELPLFTRAAEVRLDEESRQLTGLSTEALLYMHEYGLALDSYLRRHAGNLRFVADEEFDLFEALRLSERLNNVDRNIARVGERNIKLVSALVRRGVETAPDRAK